MKRKYWILYGFLNFLINFIVTVLTFFLWDGFIVGVIYGRNFPGSDWYRLSVRIDSAFSFILHCGIFTSINLLVYRFITRKYKLSNIYLLIPIGTMILGIVSVYLIMYR